jgi:hypothetical protein
MNQALLRFRCASKVSPLFAMYCRFARSRMEVPLGDPVMCAHPDGTVLVLLIGWNPAKDVMPGGSCSVAFWPVEYTLTSSLTS